MKQTFRFFTPDKGQCRDFAANDDRTAFQRVQDAQAMRRWAESRANDPGFAPFAAAAREQAEAMMRASRPRVVSQGAR